MDSKKFQETMNNIQEKLGEEASSLILDDIANLITDNQTTNNELIQKDDEITNLKKTNATLQRVNGNLLQQISMGDEEDTKNKDDKPKDEPFDFRTVFDEKREFSKMILTFRKITYRI